MVLTIIFLLTSCKPDQPNAYRCVLVTKNIEKKTAPLEQWYAYCKNLYTDEVKRIPVQDLNKRIESQDEAKWILTDLDNYDRAVKFYQNKCGE